MATDDPTPTKKRKVKDLPSSLSYITAENFRDKLNGRFETDSKESGEVMVAFEVKLEGGEKFDLTTLNLDQLRKFCRTCGVNYVNQCTKFQCRKRLWILAKYQKQREQEGAVLVFRTKTKTTTTTTTAKRKMAKTNLPPYSYSPDEILKSFRILKEKEDKALKQQEETIQTTTTATSSSFVVAAIQLTAGGLEPSQVAGFFDRAQNAVKEAVEQKGADLVLLPELFIGPYFCQSQEACLMELALEADECFIVKRMQLLAKRFRVVLPISIFERKNNTLYNSIVMIDADGSVLGTYRKSHIPDAPGYQEKFYFSPGDTGFKVWKTSVGNVGVAICWDQWFPEAARAMALQGADVLLYPTAIGSEPQDPTINSADHWQRVMQGHAAANVSIVVRACPSWSGMSCTIQSVTERFFAFLTGPTFPLPPCLR